MFRPPAVLRPHPAYQAVCGPIAAIRVSHVAQQAGAIREPLVITTDGTILDGHARWQVAMDRQQPQLLCLEYAVTEAAALQIVIDRHRTSAGLNAYGRILLALPLELCFRAGTHRPQPPTGSTPPSSKLTHGERSDTRTDIARVAGVSTGNVTKVKQLLDTVILEIRDELLRGTVSIHKAWQWRTLTAKAQHEALWAHLHRGALKKMIARLVRAHADAGLPAQPVDVAATVLSGLATCAAADLTVAIVDVPGRAVVVTRAYYDELQEKNAR